jgi:hypothetical protein
MATFSLVELIGYAAAATVFCTFWMRTMLPLRMIAILSNVLFALYGFLESLYPVLILHLTLFPVNVLRLFQIQKLVRGVHSASSAGVAIKKLIPMMTRQRLAAGQTLFTKGDKADRLYYIANGTLRIEGLNLTREAGDIVGEIGLFAPDQKRMATVVCETDCELYDLRESQVKKLYYQDPGFGFAILRLITGRLLEDYRIGG